MSKTLKRRAPKGGYSFAEKESYRNRVWSRLAENCPVPRAVAQILIMPSAEGTVDVVLRYGFREEDVHIVDRNPAIVATLKRRYAKVNTYGVEVERACARIAAKGLVIHAANFDFTSCMGFEFGKVLSDIRDSGALHANAVYAVTLLRGRETMKPGSVVDGSTCLPTGGFEKATDIKLYEDLARRLNRKVMGGSPLQTTDALRVSFMMLASPATPQCLYTLDVASIYKSGPQTMLWGVFRPVHRGKASARTVSEKMLGALMDMALVDLAAHEHSQGGGEMAEVYALQSEVEGIGVRWSNVYRLAEQNLPLANRFKVNA